MFDELEKLVSAPLNVSEDLNSAVNLPLADFIQQYSDGFVKMGKALTKIRNKLNCFLCSLSRWQLLQIVLLRTDTRLIIVYTDTDKGFVLDLTDAKRYGFMIEEDHDGKRQCTVKISWDFGSVQLRFVEAQIATWQRYVVDCFDHIFKTPIPPSYGRNRGNMQTCADAGESSDEYSSTVSVSPQWSTTNDDRPRHSDRMNDLTPTNKKVNGEGRNNYTGTKSGTSTLEQLSAQHSTRNASALTDKFELQEENDKEIIADETADNNKEASKISPTSLSFTLEASKPPTNLGCESPSSNGSSEDGPTLSVTSDADSPSAYEGDISIVADSATGSLDENLVMFELPPSHKQMDSSFTDSSSTPSLRRHLYRPLAASRVFISPIAEEEDEDSEQSMDEDAAISPIQRWRTVKSMVARWPPRGPPESSA